MSAAVGGTCFPALCVGTGRLSESDRRHRGAAVPGERKGTRGENREGDEAQTRPKAKPGPGRAGLARPKPVAERVCVWGVMVGVSPQKPPKGSLPGLGAAGDLVPTFVLIAKRWKSGSGWL